MTFFTEGGNAIGFGHLTRCVSLYQVFKKNELNSEMIIKGDSTVVSLLKDVKYKLFDWIGEHQETRRLALNTDIAVFDSYLASLRFYKKISGLAGMDVYIDDNNRLNYPSGIVINGSIDAERIGYSGNNKYLLGVRYQPMRSDFWRTFCLAPRKKLKSVLITCGGDDARGLTARIIDFLKRNYFYLKKNVIIGKGFDNKSSFAKLVDKTFQLYYFPDSRKVKDIMLNSDIAISAGGQTLYELMRLGVPTIGICVASNQIRNLLGLQRHGVIDYIGKDNNRNLFKKLRISLDNMKSDKKRRLMSDRAKDLIDGKGVFRIYSALLDLYSKNERIRRIQ